MDYHFVKRETFQKWIDEGKMFEHAMVYGEYKGVPNSQIEEAFEKQKDCILRYHTQIRVLSGLQIRCPRRGRSTKTASRLHHDLHCAFQYRSSCADFVRLESIHRR